MTTAFKDMTMAQLIQLAENNMRKTEAYKDIIDAVEIAKVALQPFADYADKRGLLDDSHVITEGSHMAKRQLKMFDCRRAAKALEELS